MKVTMMVGLVLDIDREAIEEKLDVKDAFLEGRVKVLTAHLKMTDTETKELIHDGNITQEIKDRLGSK